YHERPGLFFGLLGAWFGAVAAVIVVALWFMAPRLEMLWPPLPGILWTTVACTAIAIGTWMAALALSLRFGRNLLPPALVERGFLARVMPLVERSGRWFGISRDRAGNAALRVYNALSAARA